MTAKTKAADSTRVPRGRPPLGEAAQYRRRILDATAAVFVERGFERASTNEIARRAQTSKQTLYQLYPSKAELFVGVMTERISVIFNRHTYYIESAEPPRQALAGIGEMILDLFRSREFLGLYRILVGQVQTFPEPAMALWRACRQRGYALLAEYLKSRRIGGPDYTRTATRFVSLVLGDFLINALLDPALKLSDRDVKARVHDAVEDFFCLHPVAARRK